MPHSSPREEAQRRKQLWDLLAERDLEALLVTSRPNVRYLSGFTGSSGLLLLLAGRAVLVTDPRYEIQAHEEADCQVRVVRGPLLLAAAKLIAGAKVRHVAFERLHTSYDAWTLLHENLPARVELTPTAGLVEGLRMVKSPEEIARMRRSMETASEALDRAMKSVRPGLREFELAAELDHWMRKLGASQPAFETIMASGTRSALPHARPTDKRLKNQELLLVDFGAVRNGYVSDVTRMAYLGHPPAKVRRVYQAVLDAQLAAIAAVREGATCGSIDQAARRVLRAHGLDKAFVHSTGHGLGLEIHEPPRLGKGEQTHLRAGMAITIEPGVYLQGFGGIRIEDVVVVTPGGCEILSPSPKELKLI